MSIWSSEPPVPVVFLHGFATSTQATWVEPGWFDLVHEENMPFVIRETRRKHQFTVAHATVWRRK